MDIKGFHQGDEKEWASIVNANRPWMLSKAYTLVSDEAEDLVQITLDKAYRFRTRYDGSYKIGTWLGRIMENAAVDLGRVRNARRRIQPENTIRIEDNFGVADRALGPQEFAEGVQIREEVSKHIGRLPPKASRICRLYFPEDMSTVDIANQENMHPTTVKGTIFRARLILRPLLKHFKE